MSAPKLLASRALRSWPTRIALLVLLSVVVLGSLYMRSQRQVLDLLQLNALQNQRLEEYDRLALQVRTFNSKFGSRYGQLTHIKPTALTFGDIQKIRETPQVPSSVDSLMEELQATLAHVNDLGDKIDRLARNLGRPHYVEANETHARIASDFLIREAGLSAREAQATLQRTALIWELSPGNAVYNIYHDGIFLTTVTQGRAETSPLLVQYRYREASSRRIADLEEQLRNSSRRIEALERRLYRPSTSDSFPEEAPLAGALPASP